MSAEKGGMLVNNPRLMKQIRFIINRQAKAGFQQNVIPVQTGMKMTRSIPGILRLWQSCCQYSADKNIDILKVLRWCLF